jgi:hypothetical protein
MKQIFIFLTFACSSFCATAQTAEDSVKLAVNKLFDGMKNADAVLLKSAFADSAILQTIVAKGKDGKLVVTTDPIEEFADFVSKQNKGDPDERFTYDVIKIDGPMAIVWAPYKFYYKGVFSHCGVNSLQLVKFNNEWKIQYIIDTRHKKGCE